MPHLTGQRPRPQNTELTYMKPAGLLQGGLACPSGSLPSVNATQPSWGQVLYKAMGLPAEPTRALYSFLRNPWGQMFSFI